MTRPLSPERWAFEITHLLNAVFGADRFPIDIPTIAREYTAQRFPDDPIISVQGDNLPGFDGALFKAPAGRKGWGIFYNDRISSKGRINFTLAHEFGHFLLHRLAAHGLPRRRPGARQRPERERRGQSKNAADGGVVAQPGRCGCLRGGARITVSSVGTGARYLSPGGAAEGPIRH